MLRGISYLLIFILGAGLGSAFPSYSSQYQQRLKAQLDQVSIDLAPFQEIADEFHGGSLHDLIAHHLESNDPTFHAEGSAIQLMLDSKSELAKANSALKQSPMSQARFFIENINYDLARSTWQSYTPSIIATPAAFSFAITVGAVLCIVSYLLWGSIRWFSGYVFKTTVRN